VSIYYPSHCTPCQPAVESAFIHIAMTESETDPPGESLEDSGAYQGAQKLYPSGEYATAPGK
jgi:hypothetical protein